MSTLTVTTIMSVALLCAGVRGQTTQLQETIDSIASGSVSDQELEQNLDQIEILLTDGADQKPIVNFILDEPVPVAQRATVLNAAAAQLDCENVMLVVQYVLGQDEDPSGELFREQRALTGALQDAASKSQVLFDCVSSNPEGLVWLSTTLRAGVAPSARHLTLQWIEENRFDEVTAEQIALLAIESQPRMTHVHYVLVSALSESGIAQVRERFKKDADVGVFNCAAIATLASVGDDHTNEIIDQAVAMGIVEDGFTQGYREQAKIANNPAELLRSIETGRFNWISQDWVIRRAVQLGVPAADVRTAILAYANGAEPGDAAKLRGSKITGLDVGVLYDDDLEWVDISSAADY